MKHSIASLLLLLLLSIPSAGFTHSGRTDSNGGHYVGGTGKYHYHHGYSAHQHTDGKCPYAFDDKTGASSGSSSSVGSKTSAPKATTSPLVTTTKSAMKQQAIWPLLFLLGVLGLGIVLARASFREKKKQEGENNRLSQLLRESLESLDLAVYHLNNSGSKEVYEQSTTYRKMLMRCKTHAEKLMSIQRDALYKSHEQIEGFSKTLRSYLIEMYTTLYGGDRAHKTYVPDGITCDNDGLPIEPNELVFTFSLTRYHGYQTKYHRWGCQYARFPINASNVYLHPDVFTPCRLCKPVIKDYSWIVLYQVALSIKKKYHIE